VRPQFRGRNWLSFNIPCLRIVLSEILDLRSKKSPNGNGRTEEYYLNLITKSSNIGPSRENP